MQLACSSAAVGRPLLAPRHSTAKNAAVASIANVIVLVMPLATAWGVPTGKSNDCAM